MQRRSPIGASIFRKGGNLHISIRLLLMASNQASTVWMFPKGGSGCTMFVLNHLDYFAVEMLRNDIITKIIPALKGEVKNSGVSTNRDSPDYNLSCHYSNNPPSYMAVLWWVYHLGFKQDKFKKAYYIDGHKHLSQILHRSKFNTKYLTNLKTRSHRWV